jgi:ammonia channel protein AmtB
LTSSLFWLLLSIAVFAESVRLGIGQVHDPGRGFITFGASGILGILSLGLFIQASLRKEEGEREPLFAGKLWKRVLFVIFSLAVYSWIMPALGYLISTFLLMALLFWLLEREKILVVVLSSFVATLVTYLVFSKWLNCQFPDGLFGF